MAKGKIGNPLSDTGALIGTILKNLNVVKNINADALIDQTKKVLGSNQFANLMFSAAIATDFISSLCEATNDEYGTDIQPADLSAIENYFNDLELKASQKTNEATTKKNEWRSRVGRAASNDTDTQMEKIGHVSKRLEQAEQEAKQREEAVRRERERQLNEAAAQNGINRVQPAEWLN